MIITQGLLDILFAEKPDIKSLCVAQSLVDFNYNAENFVEEIDETASAETITVDGVVHDIVPYTDRTKCIIAIETAFRELSRSDIESLGSTIVTTYEAFSPVEGRYYSFDTEEEAVEKAKQITRALVEQYNVHVNRKVANEHGHFAFETTIGFAEAVENM